MADDKKKKDSAKRINEKDRMKFIGFEVFPGKTKDLFKSDAEKGKLIKNLQAKRASGEIVREECLLCEERVSTLDRFTLLIACLVIFVALFVPWYGVYNEIEEVVAVTHEEQNAVDEVMDSTALALGADSLLADSLGVMAAVVDSSTMIAATDETAEATPEEIDGAATEEVSSGQHSSAEEILHGYVAKKTFTKEHSRLSGLGSLISIGSIGGDIFSSGFVLIITGILFLVYTLLCIGLPAYTIYGLFGLKGSADEKALKLKKILRYNWLPLILFTGVLVFSFFGAEYSFDAASTFSSLGSSYGIGALLDTLSYGIIISLCASILVAVKGVEI